MISNLLLSFVIFDTDGTLVEDLDLIVAAYNYAVSEYLGREFSVEEVSAFFGPPMSKIVAKAVPPELLDSAVNKYHDYYSDHFHERARAFPGVREMLTSLKKAGYRLGVLTGAGRVAAKITLEKSGLSQFFDVVVTGDDVTHPKPDPEGLGLAIRLMKASPERSVCIGDSPLDIQGSRRFGIRSGAALWGSRNIEEVRELKPDFIFNSPSDVEEALLSLNGKLRSA